MWRGYSVYTSGYHSVDRLSDIDEFEESLKMGTSNQPGTSLQDSVDNLSLETGDLLDYSVDDDVEEEEEVEDVDGAMEEEEDEDSTPHIMSETSLERQLEEPLCSSPEEDEVMEDFNRGEKGKSLAEELALEIELESDKSRLQGEGGGAGPEEINAEQFLDNKISQQTVQHHLKADLSGEDTSPARSLQTKTDFGIVSGKIL